MVDVGTGWSEAEFAALGVPFIERSRRTREYVEALRAFWSEDPASYLGKFVDPRAVRSFREERKGDQGRKPDYERDHFFHGDGLFRVTGTEWADGLIASPASACL
jgi:alkanesulfonate monooxygenase SsuD/methylene tetrahydromethanopterin reductase-like flavin-dependent oxidoreductase (luciferase family)